MFKKRHPRAGSRPGTLVISDDAAHPRVHLMQYSRDNVREETLVCFDDLDEHLDDETVTWIDVQGLGDADLLRKLADAFTIHPLALEDIVNTPQRPKAELYGYQQLIVCRAFSLDQAAPNQEQQISIVVGPNYILTFQEQYGELLEPVRQRIHLSDSRLRQSGPDYLAYAVMDAIVDAYYPAVETLSDALQRLEDLVIERPDPQLLKRLNSIRVQLSRLRRAVWPKRELIRSLIHDDNPLIGEQARLFLRDTHDHAVQTSEIVEMCKEMVSGLMNTYISSVGHRTNEVMKVLTIMSSIFVPLTFLAGIYGMNFEHMPELQFKWAYPSVWLAMLGCVAGMMFYFRQKGWIGRAPSGLVSDPPNDRQDSSDDFGYQVHTPPPKPAQDEPQIAAIPIESAESLSMAEESILVRRAS